MKIVLIVPTKDRHYDIERLLKSISIQKQKPDQVIIVDGSDRPVDDIALKYSSHFSIDYVACRPPSLPKQRNVGISRIQTDADWVGFLDDDLVLEEDCLANLAEFIKNQNSPKLKGVALNILNQPIPKTPTYNKFFLMDSTTPGKITPSGYPAVIPCTQTDLKTDWLYGGATFWASHIFKDYLFDEWFFGTGYMEDIDFSYRVSRKYELMVSSQSKCYHYHHGISIGKEVSIGEWQLTSWWYFVNKYNDFNRPAVLWSMLGLIMKNLVRVLYFRSKSHALRSKGHIMGIYKILLGKANDIKGFQK
ncbi:MAG: glycosyltransferase [Bacteriovoracaceae bacterium]|nr:glycosyltransferase [Bacteriovoracaceae bacterium]